MNGNELKALRLRKGMTQEDVARTIGVSRITIRNWELGINTPNAAYIPKLARLFGCPVDEVIRFFG